MRADKELNGYMSLEAGYLFPILLFIYYLVILSSLLLLVRCLTSQNDYIVGMRAASFSRGEEEYGEVIYGTDEGFDAESYAISRLEMADRMYVAFPTKSIECISSGGSFSVRTYGGDRIGRNDCSKECIIVDPVGRIREQRY
ncbi:MAG: hypothetical protein K5888_00400 [Lachnospiraceae bacterium]|nr:hypothetical protein [Lachnospiraceae bacterium]